MSEVSPLFGNFIYAPTEEEALIAHALQGRWKEVVKMYKDNYEWIYTTTINRFQDTVLHAAVDSGEERIVAELVNVIVGHEKVQGQLQESALAIQNARRDTPLHLAASRGFANMCYCIVGEKNERAHLMKLRNDKGETPLFLAALNWHKDAFLYLHHCSSYTIFDLTRHNGDTILHCAIRREYFDLAVIIIHKHKDLIGYVNENDETPLKVLATRPLAFRSGSNLRWWNKLLYYCTLVEQVDVETATGLPPKSTLEINFSDPDANHKRHPENYETCCHFLGTLPKIPALFGYFIKKQKSGDTENPKTRQKKEDTVDQKLGNLPPNYATFSECLRSACVLAAGLSGLGMHLVRVKRMKEKHVWSAQLLGLLMEEPTEAYFGSGIQPFRVDQSNQEILDFRRNSNNQGQEGNSHEEKKNKDDKKEKKDRAEDEIDMKDTTFLIAVKNGILEIVDEILRHIPIVIQDTSLKHKRNILLVAVESRQPFVVETLRKQKLWKNLILGVDTEENTALHLAAGRSRYRAWQIPGSAMQMLWDIKWYEYVKDLVPHHFHLRHNQSSQTPPEIFKEKHEKLVEEGSAWLKDTSESCSVVAALIAGVAFATSSAVPGGNNEETGKPNYEGQPAFNVFAITSLVALCFSVTALIMFLAILTSRKTAKDFRKDLPFKLLLGLSSLFVSIASMLVSFCAAHFFVVKDKFKGILFPIYAATCLPVSFYAIAQFPLYVDLLRAIFKKVPQPSDKGSDL